MEGPLSISCARSGRGTALGIAALSLCLVFSGTAIAIQRLGQSSQLPRVARQLASRLPVRIVAFGSSSTEGVGATSPSATYPARLEGELNQALPGENKR